MIARLSTADLFGGAMARRRIAILISVAIVMLGGVLSAMRAGNMVSPQTPPQAASLPDLGTLPLHFEPNVGQADPQARFITRAPGGTLFFTPSGVVLSLQAPSAEEKDGSAPQSKIQNSQAVHMQFVGANPSVAMERGMPLPGKINYFVGNDPTEWHAGVSTHSGIDYIGLYRGIDLNYSGTGGRLKGTYTLAAGVAPEIISWRYVGASGVEVDAAGNLLITVQGSGDNSVLPTQHSVLTEQAPVAWQEIGGQRVPVRAAYSLRQDGGVGFSLGEYSAAHPLTIDPTLVLPYSTYLGGNGLDAGSDIAVDGEGYAYITGDTESTNFPTRSPYQTNRTGDDAFVTKLDTRLQGAPSLIYSTYLGGNDEDKGSGIAIDGAGNAYITGFTNSTDFPTFSAYQTDQPGYDAFVTKLGPSGSSLAYSTYLGGGSGEDGRSIAVDAGGNAYIIGDTSSSDFPTRNPYQTDQPDSDVFVARLNPALSGNQSLVYSTYLGGSDIDLAQGIALGAEGNAYVTGHTKSTNFPLRNHCQANQPDDDAFVTRLDTALSGNQSLVYSTYLGGNAFDAGNGIAVDGAGNAYVTGSTESTNFPMFNQYQTNQAASDAFVTKLGPSGSSILYSTYLGGSDSDYGSAIALDSEGNAYVAGSTNSLNFPTRDAYQAQGPGADVFVAKLDTTLAGTQALVYSTYLGGESYEDARGLAVDSDGSAYVTGKTNSTNFPINNQYQANQPDDDAYVAKLVVPTPTLAPCALQFTDVSVDSPFYPFVRCLACRGIMGGYGDNTFRPQNDITRGQIAKMVSGAAGYDESVEGTQTYADVPSSQTFWLWIERLSLHDVMGGYACGGTGEPCDGQNRPYFRPNNNATRGQLSKIVSNAAGYGEPPNGQMFEDVAPNNAFYPFIQRLVTRNIMGGYLCGGPGEPCGEGNKPYFRPNTNVTRGQASKIVANTFYPGCQTP